MLLRGSGSSCMTSVVALRFGLRAMIDAEGRHQASTRGDAHVATTVRSVTVSRPVAPTPVPAPRSVGSTSPASAATAPPSTALEFGP